MKTLVLGLGNPILGDDSVGLRVAQQLDATLSEQPEIDIDIEYWGGLRLMERMVGYERAIIVDAICSGAPAGTIHILSPGDMPTQRSASAHDVNLPTALEVGRQAGAALPREENITLVAIEAVEVLTFGESLTAEVEAAIPRAAQAVLAILDLPAARA
jgi:hydrogenase maturation protease